MLMRLIFCSTGRRRPVSRRLVDRPAYKPLIELVEVLLSRMSSTGSGGSKMLTQLKQRSGKLGVPGEYVHLRSMIPVPCL